MKAEWKEEGARLRKVRRACGMVQGDLAEVLGCSRSAVSMYERGRRELSEEARAWVESPLGFARQPEAAQPAGLAESFMAAADEVKQSPVYQQGAQAARDGVSVAACPYDMPRHRDEWFAGYYAVTGAIGRGATARRARRMGRPAAAS